MEQNKEKVSFGQWWDKARPTKTLVFWSWVAVIILTLFIGFGWGGWVTGGTAEVMAQEAIVQRLVPICVGQFNQDPGKDQKLQELQEKSSYQRDDYVRDQGWATIFGEEQPNRKVADECVTQLMQLSQEQSKVTAGE